MLILGSLAFGRHPTKNEIFNAEVFRAWVGDPEGGRTAECILQLAGSRCMKGLSNPATARTGHSTSESRHDQIPFMSLDLSKLLLQPELQVRKPDLSPEPSLGLSGIAIFFNTTRLCRCDLHLWNEAPSADPATYAEASG